MEYNQAMKIWIVIPLYNEKKHIGGVLHETLKNRLPIVVIDDGSIDGGGKIVNKYPVSLLTHKINLGKGAAMHTGSDFAFGNGADAVIFMDSDGQHSPKNIKEFIDQLKLKNTI